MTHASTFCKRTSTKRRSTWAIIKRASCHALSTSSSLDAYVGAIDGIAAETAEIKQRTNHNRDLLGEPANSLRHHRARIEE